MAVPVEEAIAALSTFSLEDDQLEIQGAAFCVTTERGATISPIEYSDVSAYRLSLSEDTKAINQLNYLAREGNEMCSVLYTYRSCVKALPQLPDSMKHSQADLYLETYQVLDLEMGRLREIQHWQASAASKLAADMQRFSRPERRLNGPTVTHLWSMLKLLDVLVQLDHLKNGKASIPNDFSWYKRTFTQVSMQWQDSDTIREELDDLQIFLSTRWAILLNLHVEMFRVNNVDDILQVLIVFVVESLDLNFALLFPERHILLRVLPVLVVLAASSEKDSESLYKRVKLNKLIGIFKKEPMIPSFPDLHLSPASMLKELATFFPRFSTQNRLLTLPSPHELPLREAQEYQREFSVAHNIGTIRAEHDDFTIRFASALNQLALLRSLDGTDMEWAREVKGNVYDMVVEGFQLLSRWTARIWNQSAWKFSRPCKDPDAADLSETAASPTDYEKVVRYNYNADETKTLVELVSYIKGIGSLMQKSDTLVADSLWETLHSEVQDFVQNTLATMKQTTFKKKRDISRILSDMCTLSADWMANSKPESEMQALQQGGEENKVNIFYPRPVAPTTAQIHCLQFLIHEVVSGGNLRKPGGLFSNTGSEIPASDLKHLETFFYKLGFFLHILDYTATITNLTDVGFLWFREFYLESSRVIQFPIECSLPWMLVDHVLESQDGGLLESVLMPFEIYNDAAQNALVVLKQRFLYDEIEAEVDNCFDIFVSKLCDVIFTHYKCRAASELLDPSFLFSIDTGEKFSVQPLRFTALFKMTRVKLLGRTVNLRSLISERINKIFRDNIEFLFDRFECQDLCAIVELEKLIQVVQLSHELLSKDLALDSFSLMLSEIQENVSLVSYSSRLASQIWTEMQNDFLPNYILCNTTQRFVRSLRVSSVPIQKPSVPHAKPNFYCGTQALNSAYQSFARLYSAFFGMPHMRSIIRLLGSRSLPWLIRALLDHVSNKIATLEPIVTVLQEALPKSIGLLPFDNGVAGCMRIIQENLNCWQSRSELKSEVLRGVKEIGSVLYWMSLLDIVLREADTSQFMQIAPWLGLVPGADGQVIQFQEGGDSPVVNLFKSLASLDVSNHSFLSSSFKILSRQAEAADLLYKSNMNAGSVLEYSLAFTSAALDKYCSKWSLVPRSGFVDITTSKDFYRIYSALQIEYLEETSRVQPNQYGSLGDSVAWGGCTIMHLLGQHLHFELFDFSHQVLNVAEVETASISPTHKNSQGHEGLIEAMRKARRLNSHVFSMLKARCPLEDKQACAIRQNGMPVHRIKFQNTVSAFDTLPQKGA